MGRGQLKVFSAARIRSWRARSPISWACRSGKPGCGGFRTPKSRFQIDENIRGTDVFIVQPTCAPVDQHLIELCVMIDAFRRSSASRITAVIPYYGYARQDRKDKPRVPISAKLVANLLSAAGANRVLTMDLHKAQIQGFFDIPVDHLFAAPVIIDYLARLGFPRPDDRLARRRRRGTRARLREAARRRAGDHRQAAQRRRDRGSDERHRRRRGPDVHHPGRHHRHRGHDREGGAGAEKAAPSACSPAAVHGVLSGPAIERLEKAPIEKVIITNTIPLNGAARGARRSWCSRWRACWARRSGASTRRRRSRRCSCSSRGIGR